MSKRERREGKRKGGESLNPSVAKSFVPYSNCIPPTHVHALYRVFLNLTD